MCHAKHVGLFVCLEALSIHVNLTTLLHPKQVPEPGISSAVNEDQPLISRCYLFQMTWRRWTLIFRCLTMTVTIFAPMCNGQHHKWLVLGRGHGWLWLKVLRYFCCGMSTQWQTVTCDKLQLWHIFLLDLHTAQGFVTRITLHFHFSTCKGKKVAC